MELRLATMKDVKEVYGKYHPDNNKEVSVSCDEMHGHSARRGCLHGPEEHIRILQLCEVVFYLQGGLEAVVAKAGEWSLKEE